MGSRVISRFTAGFGALALVAAMAACEHNPAAPGVLASITVTRNPDTLAIGTSRQFIAIGRDANGTVVGVNPTWSLAAGGGTISSTGMLTAGTAPGTFISSVKATLGSLSGTATFVVTPGPVASVTVTPTPVTLAIGATQQFIAVAKDASGNVLAITPVWSAAPGVGSMGSAGLLTAGTVAGTYTNGVTATVGLMSGSATVTVTAGALASITVTPNPTVMAIGAVQTFTAVGKDAGGNVVPLTPTWSVQAGGGTISAAAAFTAGTLAGTFVNTVRACSTAACGSGSISGSATVTVGPGALAFITVSPNPKTLAIGATQQYTAVGTDLSGNVVALAPSWSVQAGGGTINNAGLFTAGTVAGTFANTVTASVATLSGSATVTVTPAVLASITVTPNPAVLPVGGVQQFTATGRDASGNLVAITPTWTVQAGGGSVDGVGLFTAGAVAGTFANTVRAASGGISGFATVTVTAGGLASITVTPNPVDLGTNAAQQFTAVGRDAGGNVVPIPSPVWSVRPGYAGGTILSSGGYTAPAAVGVGFDTVRATSGSIFGSARVNVKTTGVLVAIAVTPNPANVIAGATATFTATGFDATGLVVPTPGLTWSIVASGGTIGSGTGLFTAGATTGTFPNTVRATSGAISGYATVNVNPVPPAGPSLGAAGTHGILAGSTITCASAPGTVNGDASVWPGSAVTGFPPCTITGATHAGDPFAQTAQGDLTAAFLALAAMPCGTTITADLGGTTLAPGVYCSGSSVGVTGTVTLAGPAGAVFVIRAPSTLTTAGSVVMSGGATAANVYWWVGSSATLGPGSAWQGNILAFTSVTLNNNATLVGRALARNGAVTLGTGNTITLP